MNKEEISKLMDKNNEKIKSKEISMKKFIKKQIELIKKMLDCKDLTRKERSRYKMGLKLANQSIGMLKMKDRFMK